MKITSKKMLALVASCAATVTVMSVGAVVITQKRGVWRRAQEKQPVTDTLPPIISRVKDLEVVEATIDERTNIVFIKVKNNSKIPVTSVTLVQGSVSSGIDGETDFSGPNTVIEPGGTVTFTEDRRFMDKNTPIFVGGAIFADGTEDGMDIVLEEMRESQAEMRAKREAKKQGGPRP